MKKPSEAATNISAVDGKLWIKCKEGSFPWEKMTEQTYKRNQLKAKPVVYYIGEQPPELPKEGEWWLCKVADLERVLLFKQGHWVTDTASKSTRVFGAKPVERLLRVPQKATPTDEKTASELEEILAVFLNLQQKNNFDAVKTYLEFTALVKQITERKN
jgi:hypothetical protein